MLEFIQAVNFGWCFVAIALLGQLFVANNDNLKGFCLWVISNLYLVTTNFYAGNYDQAFLFSVYTGLCLFGIYKQLKPKKVQVRTRYY
jgi:hypothetical protein